MLCILTGFLVFADVLKSLVQLHGLTDLNISSCDDVSDEGLEFLAALTDLDSLNAVDCGISDKGIDLLKKVNIAFYYTSVIQERFEFQISGNDDDRVWRYNLRQAINLGA